MNLLVTPSTVGGTIAVPGSKSHTIRAITAGLLAGGVSEVRAPLISGDTVSALNAATALGAVVEKSARVWRIRGTGGAPKAPEKAVDMGNSGTGLRMLFAAAALADSPVTFDGDDSLRTRPMKPLADALRMLGARVIGDRCPITVEGRVRGGHCRVEAVSSQFLTALLFALPAADRDSVIEVPILNEAPYVAITLEWLKKCRIKVNGAPDCSRFELPGGQTFAPFTATIPADFSTACFPLAAALALHGKVMIENLDFSDAQGDKEVFSMLEQMGAKIERTRGGALVDGASSRLTGCTLDLNRTPDALPALAVCACFASGETRLVNVPQARIKETDRIACMARELSKMGADVEELPDGLVVRESRLHGAEVESYNDHRIAMSLAIAACGADGASRVRNMEAAAVTYPAFVEDFRELGAVFEPEG